MEDGRPILHPDLRTESLAGPEGNGAAAKPTNIAKHFQFKMGDPDQGFADAAVVIERAFKTATVHQGYIEPHNATALWNADDTITVWCSTQGAFTVRAQLAELLQTAGLAHQGRADGDRRRLRRQDPRLPRTGRRPAQPRGRPPGQGADEPGGGL